MKVGIALAGGGVRGAAHLGVIQALEEAGVKVSVYTGTSAGSIVATMKASGATNEQCMEILAEVDKSLMDIAYLDILLSIPTKFRNLDSIFKGERLRQILDKYMYEIEYDSMPNELAIISTDIFSGTQIIFTNSDASIQEIDTIDNDVKVISLDDWPPIHDMVYSSCALPGVFRPLKHEDMGLVDGSITNNLPANIAMSIGAEKVIAVHLSEESPKSEPIRGIHNIVGKSINILVGQTSFLSVSHSHDVFELFPNVSNIGLLEFNKAKDAYIEGYKHTTERMPEILKYLKAE